MGDIITGLTHELTETPALADLMVWVDVSDTTQAGTGTTKKSKAQYGIGFQVNPQTGTTYTYQATDFRKLVTHTNGSAIAGTLPQAGASFPAGWFMFVQNRGAGALTITPTTSTIDGAASLVLNQNEGALIVSDGTNYFTFRGRRAGNPMTTAEDIIKGGTSGVETRLAKGSNGDVLQVSAGLVVWGAAPGGSAPGGSAGGDLSGAYPNPSVIKTSLTGAHGSDDTWTGSTVSGLNAGATIAQWEAVYLDSSSTWQLADANGTGTYPARGLATAAYVNTNPAVILVHGTVRNDAWNWTPGGTIYLSGTAGALTQTAPSTSGDKVQQVGFALTADIAFFDFNSTYLTVT